MKRHRKIIKAILCLSILFLVTLSWIRYISADEPITWSVTLKQINWQDETPYIVTQEKDGEETYVWFKEDGSKNNQQILKKQKTKNTPKNGKYFAYYDNTVNMSNIEFRDDVFQAIYANRNGILKIDKITPGRYTFHQIFNNEENTFQLILGEDGTITSVKDDNTIKIADVQQSDTKTEAFIHVNTPTEQEAEEKIDSDAREIVKLFLIIFCVIIVGSLLVALCGTL